MTEHETLTEDDLALLQTPVKELSQTGRLPSAMSVVEKKFRINRNQTAKGNKNAEHATE